MSDQRYAFLRAASRKVTLKGESGNRFSGTGGPGKRSFETVETPKRLWWALAALCVPLVMVSIDATILNVALPSIARDLGTTDTQLIWINSAYIIMFGATILFSGNLADKYGRKLALMTGMLVFIAGSIWAGLSPGPGSLVEARILQGAGGGLIMPATLALITNIFPSGTRPRAIAIWAGISGVGVALGPILGGILLSAFFWGSVFFVNVPVVIVGLIAVHFLVPGSKDSKAPSIDYAGVVLSTLGLFCFFYFLIQEPNLHFTNWKVLTALGLSVLLIGGFILRELRCDHPLLDIRLFRNKAFSSGVLTIAIAFFALYGLLYELTLYLQSVREFSALKAGFALVPFAVVLLLAAPAAPRLAVRVGNRWLGAGGLMILTVGLLVFLMVGVESGYWVVFLGLVLVGLGISLVTPPSSNAVMSSVPPEKTGMGASANAAIRQVGGSMGIALIGGIAALVYGHRVVESGVLSGLSSSMVSAARSSINGAIEVSQRLPGSQAESLIKAADSAFVNGFHAAMVMIAIIAGASVLIALWAIPREKLDMAKYQPRSLR